MFGRDLQGIGFYWQNFAPYHVDMLDAVAEHFGERMPICGIELAPLDPFYPWKRSDRCHKFELVTLFPGMSFDKLSRTRRFFALRRAIAKKACKHVFLCHYQEMEVFFLAIYLRLTGRRVFIIQDSKFDDKKRYLIREILKVLWYKPYNGAIVASKRTKDYLRLLGFQEDKLFAGYDVISIDRVRQLAGTPTAPGGVAYKDRHFAVIARLVPKKNISLALKAYGLYAKALGDKARHLAICGSGELEDRLREEAKELGLTNVEFRGWLSEQEVAGTLGATLALIVPSTEEQWGLIVNNALAMGVPVLCSDNVGARDYLVKSGVNGYVFEPDNADGLAYFMKRLTVDEAEWKRFAKNSLKLADRGDVEIFVRNVEKVVGLA